MRLEDHPSALGSNAKVGSYVVAGESFLEDGMQVTVCSFRDTDFEIFRYFFGPNWPAADRFFCVGGSQFGNSTKFSNFFLAAIPLR